MADQTLRQLANLRLAVAMCQEARRLNDPNLQRMAELWCVSNFNIVCADCEDMSWRDIRKIIQWLQEKNEKSN